MSLTLFSCSVSMTGRNWSLKKYIYLFIWSLKTNGNELRYENGLCTIIKSPLFYFISSALYSTDCQLMTIIITFFFFFWRERKSCHETLIISLRDFFQTRIKKAYQPKTFECSSL